MGLIEEQEESKKPDGPLDQLTRMLRFARDKRPHEYGDLDSIARRIAAANFGSTHQASIQVTHLLLDILGSDAEHNTIAVLRDEMNKVLCSDGNPTWTKAKVAKMVKADSAARETLRLHTFGGRSIMRKVVAPGGAKVDGHDGLVLPQGTYFSFLSRGAHVDGETYEDPLKYDPFRFSRVRERSNDATLSFVTTSLDLAAFGHGKHACPGRFIVDFEMKMFIAYILLDYDVEFPSEYGGKRPENVWVTEAQFPPPGVRMRFRRKEN